MTGKVRIPQLPIAPAVGLAVALGVLASEARAHTARFGMIAPTPIVRRSRTQYNTYRERDSSRNSKEFRRNIAMLTIDMGL